jgi:hypothetical protein
MAKALQISIYIFFACQFISCTGLEYPKAEVYNKDDNFTSLSYTADLRAVHVIKKGDNYWVLAEPTPDAAFSYDQDEGMNIDLSLISTGDKTQDGESVSSGSDDLPLTGRASYVLFARELSYRMNEMALNLNMTPEQYMEMYKAAMGTIEKVASIEAAQITTTNNTTVTTGMTSNLTRSDTQEEKIDDSISETNSKTESTDDSISETKSEDESSSESN